MQDTKETLGIGPWSSLREEQVPRDGRDAVRAAPGHKDCADATYMATVTPLGPSVGQSSVGSGRCRVNVAGWVAARVDPVLSGAGWRMELEVNDGDGADVSGVPVGRACPAG